MTRRHVDLLRVMPPTALHPAVMRGLAHGMRDARAGLGGRMPVSGWGSVVSGGAFDMEFDSSWSPPMDEDSLHDTQSFVWATFWSDLMDHIDETGMTFSRVHDLIRTYDASTELGNFWNFGWGPTHQGFLYAVQLILTYHASLLESIPPCDDAAYLINYLLTHRDRFFKIKADWGAEFTHFAAGGLTNLVTQVSGGEFNDHSLGQYNSFTNNITISGSFAHEFAFIADNYLYQAHRACWYTSELRVPDLLTGIYYLWQAQQLGKLALGSISSLSHTIIHELCHRLFGTSHCSNECCMQRVAMRFQCNLSAKLGLYAVGFGDDRIDLDLTGVSFFRGSMCRSGREAECPIDSDRAGGICMECTMDNPGDEASPDAWASTSPWTRPVGCD